MANSINLNTQTNFENNINNQNFRLHKIQYNDLLMKNRRLQSEVEDLKKNLTLSLKGVTGILS
jgi:hypothetical protein